MVDEQLIGYIRENLKKGFSVDSLREILINEGWDPAEVDEAFAIVQSPAFHAHEEPPPSPPKSHPLEAEPRKEAAQEEEKKSVPLPVTMLSFLGILYAVILILTAVTAIFFVGSLEGYDLTFLNETTLQIPLVPLEEIAFLVNFLAFLNIVIALVYLLGFLLLLRMKRSGWIILMFMGILSAIINGMNLGISFGTGNALILVFWIAVIAYLLIKRKLFI